MRLANSSVIVVNVGPNPLEDEQLELSACFKDDWCYFFSELGQVSLAWRKTSSQPTGSCEQYTHKYSTYRVAQHDYISSREHAWLKSCKAQDCTSLCHQNNCHPRVMSRPLPHLTLTTSTSSLSPISSTSLTFPTVSLLHTGLVILDPYIPCDVPRQSGGSTQIPSLTGYESKSVDVNSIDTEAIEPEDLEPRRP